jgi:hypothetical protein
MQQTRFHSFATQQMYLGIKYDAVIDAPAERRAIRILIPLIQENSFCFFKASQFNRSD